MAEAIIGLFGVAFGAVMALVGSALSEQRQARREHERWLRDQRAAGYGGLFRSLVRGARGSQADLVEALSQLGILTSICRPGKGTRLLRASEELEIALGAISARDLARSTVATKLARRLVAECARLDLGGESRPKTTRRPTAIPIEHRTDREVEP
jgi:hypothetical protein